MVTGLYYRQLGKTLVLFKGIVQCPCSHDCIHKFSTQIIEPLRPVPFHFDTLFGVGQLLAILVPKRKLGIPGCHCPVLRTLCTKSQLSMCRFCANAVSC